MTEDQIPGCTQKVKCRSVPQCAQRGVAPCDVTGTKSIGYVSPTGRTRSSGPNMATLPGTGSRFVQDLFEKGQCYHGGHLLHNVPDKDLPGVLVGLNDPCDEMLTTKQVVEYVMERDVIWWEDAKSVYDRAAAIWGVPRDEAMRRIYAHCYGG